MSRSDPTERGRTDADVLTRLLGERWSCRAFRAEPVPREVIVQVLQIARLTPSWCNTQPWQVHVTEGDATERFRRLAGAAAAGDQHEPDFAFPRRYTGAFQDRRRAVARQLYDSVDIAWGDREASRRQSAKNFEFFSAPHVAIVSTEADQGVYGAVDCGLYVNNFLLAAQSLGLGAVPQAALAAVAPSVRAFFDLPPTRLVLCGISFGWPDLEQPVNTFRTPRVDVEDAVTWVG